MFMQLATDLQRATWPSLQVTPNRTGTSTERSILLETSAALLDLPAQLYNQISMNVPYSSLWGEIETFPERRPYTFNVCLATVKTTTADLLVQLSEASGRSDVSLRGCLDLRRSMTFMVFGFLYVGIIQWMIYVSAMSALCPRAIIFGNEPLSDKLLDQAGQYDLFKQVCFDNFFVNPFIYFPTFYLIKGALAGKPVRSEEAFEASKEVEATSPKHCEAKHGPRLPEALQRYIRNFWEDNIASTLVWAPVDVLVFSAPIYLRMPFDHAFSFAWTMFLSHRRGGKASE